MTPKLRMIQGTIASLAALLLVACGGDAEQAASDGRTASGEILEGSISDAMLPLDQLRSKPPRLEPEDPAQPDAEADSADTADAENEAAPSGDAITEAIAASPAEGAENAP